MRNVQVAQGDGLDVQPGMLRLPARGTGEATSSPAPSAQEAFRLPGLDLLTRLLAFGDDRTKGDSKDPPAVPLPSPDSDPGKVFNDVEPLLQKLRSQGFAEIDHCRDAGTAFTPLAQLIFETTLSQDLHERIEGLRRLDPNSKLDRPAWQRNLLRGAQTIAPIIDLCSPALAALERWELQSPVVGTLGKIAGGMTGAFAGLFIIKAGAAMPQPTGEIVAALGAAVSLTSYCFSQVHLFPLVYGFADRLKFNAKLKECLATDPKAVDAVKEFLRRPQES